MGDDRSLSVTFSKARRAHSPTDFETWVEADVAPTLNVSELKGSDIRATTIVADPVSAHEGKTYTHEGKNNFRTHNVVVSEAFSIDGDDSRVCGAVSSKWAKGTGGPAGDEAYNLTVAPTVNGSQRQQVDGAMTVDAVGIPRRLMPLECERLQGWPDGWTNVPKVSILEGDAGLFDTPFTELAYDFPSDTKRYRAIGNGVAKPIAEWIGWRIRLAAIHAYLTLSGAAP